MGCERHAAPGGGASYICLHVGFDSLELRRQYSAGLEIAAMKREIEAPLMYNSLCLQRSKLGAELHLLQVDTIAVGSETAGNGFITESFYIS